MNDTIDIGDGADRYRFVAREAYEREYTRLARMANDEGGWSLAAESETVWGNIALTPLRKALVLTIVKKRDGIVYLLTADQADQGRLKQATNNAARR